MTRDLIFRDGESVRQDGLAANGADREMLEDALEALGVPEYV